MKKAFTKFITNLLQKLLDSGKLDTLLDKGAALLADEIIQYLEEYEAKNTPTQPTQQSAAQQVPTQSMQQASAQSAQAAQPANTMAK